jgi:hypothetical protein
MVQGEAMIWLLGFMAACVVIGFVYWLASPRVPEEQIAEADRDLVRDQDRAAWRRLRLQAYKSWKRNDDFYRIAAFRKLVAGGMSEADAKARVREEFPFYYLDPAARDTEDFTGDDCALPVVLRPRVERNSRVLKELAAEKDPRFRTMNALIRTCVRKGVF